MPTARKLFHHSAADVTSGGTVAGVLENFHELGPESGHCNGIQWRTWVNRNIRSLACRATMTSRAFAGSAPCAAESISSDTTFEERPCVRSRALRSSSAAAKVVETKGSGRGLKRDMGESTSGCVDRRNAARVLWGMNDADDAQKFDAGRARAN